MAGLLIGDKTISYNTCAAQMFFTFATVENYLLAAMAYDRYAAVCKPLHYTTTLMVCARLAYSSCIFGILTAAIDVGDTFYLSFCTSIWVHHFFCDIPAVMSLTCSDKDINELIVFLISGFNIFFASCYSDFLLAPYLSPFWSCSQVKDTRRLYPPPRVPPCCSLHICGVGSHLLVLTSQFQPLHGLNKRCICIFFVAHPMLNPVVYSLKVKVLRVHSRRLLRRQSIL